MNISLPNLMLHLCHEHQRAPEDMWQSGLHPDLFKSFVGHYLTFPDIVRSAGVCQVWRKRIQDNQVGMHLLEKAGLSAIKPESWMNIYAEWFNTKVFIALDVSSSMKFTALGTGEPIRIDIAREKLAEIARCYEPVMRHKGIHVTLFAAKAESKIVRTVEELLGFVEKHRWLQPNKSELSKALNGITKKHRKLNAKTGVPSTVFAISDMGLALSFKQLKSKALAGLKLKLIKVGKSQSGGRLFAQLESDYQADQAAQRMEEETSNKARRSTRIKEKTASKPAFKRERVPELEITFESITEKKAKTAP